MKIYSDLVWANSRDRACYSELDQMAFYITTNYTWHLVRTLHIKVFKINYICSIHCTVLIPFTLNWAGRPESNVRWPCWDIFNTGVVVLAPVLSARH